MTEHHAHRHGHRGTGGSKRGSGQKAETRSPTYNSWRSMLERCYREKHPRYARYGGRGIEVCDRWRYGEGGLGAFLCFLADMGERPSLGHSLERLDKDGPYARTHKGETQCVWATVAVQNRNRSNTRLVEFRGQSMTIREAYEMAECKLPFGSVVDRVARGKDIWAALTVPLRKGKRRKQ